MTLREAAQAVIDRWDTPLWKDVPATATYINALREALAQPERFSGACGKGIKQEPVAYKYKESSPETGEFIYAEPVQREQEPVAWMSQGKERLEFSRKDTVYGSHTIPLYTTPPNREWVGLTDAERAECWSSSAVQSALNIEAKLKWKNT
jgi:hypothetical protein